MRGIICLLTMVVLGLFYGCGECDDCKDLQQKNILVQNGNGTNLLFGDGAVYNPEQITISTSDDNPQPLFIDEDTQTLQFFLEENETTYTLRLDDSTFEVLNFDLAERDSERCCGTQTFSTSTSLNGALIDNTDRITIVK